MKGTSLLAVVERLRAVGPYKGLAAFDDSELDALLFFGRDLEREVIEANLFASRLTVLYGQTGVGKSSLLRAGLIHELRKRARRNQAERGHPEFAPVLFDRWSHDPVEGLAQATYTELAGLFGDSVVAPRSEHESLVGVLDRWSRELDCDLLLVLDQAEEYFVYHDGEPRPDTFAEQLPEIVARPFRTNVLLSLREDQLGQLDRFKGRIPNLFANYLRVDHLDPRAATAAIVEPLERYNELVDDAGPVTIEPTLVQAILEETLAGKVDLGNLSGGGLATRGPVRIEAPYLQLVLQRLWQEEQAAGSNALRLETLRALGGAEEIARTHLERALAELDEPGRDVAASVFLHLVTPSGTKIAHAVGDLAEYTGTPAAELELVLGLLARKRILKPVKTPGHDSANGSYEIFHDVLGDAVLAWRARHAAQRALERERLEAGRRQRRVLGMFAVALVALTAMTAIASYALVQRSDAHDRARSAEARRLAASASSQLDKDPELGVLLALEAARREASPEIEDVLRRALFASHERLAFRGRAADLSSDGRQLAVAQDTGKVDLFELPAGRRIATLDHGKPADTVRFDGPGRLLTVGGGIAHEWDVTRATNEAELPFLAGGRDTVAVARLDDGAVTVQRDGALHFWTSSPDGYVSSFVRRLPRRVTSVSAAPGRPLLAAVAGKGVYLVPARRGAQWRLIDHGALVQTTAFDPTGHRLVTAGGNRFAIVWNVDNGRLLRRLAGHSAPVLEARFSPDGSTVATASVDGVGRIFDAKTGDLTATLFGHDNYVTGVAYSGDGRFLATMSLDGTARVWETAGRLLAVLRGHAGDVTSSSFSRNGNLLVTAGKDGAVRVWDPRPEPDLRAVRKLAMTPSAAAFTDHGTLLRIAGRGGPTSIVAVADGRKLRSVDAPPRPAVVQGPDGRTARIAGKVVHVRTASGASVVLRGHVERVTSVAFSVDGARLVTASSDRDAAIWDADTGARTHLLRGHFGPVSDAAFSADGRWVVTAGPRTGGVWDADSGRLLFFIRGLVGPFAAASFVGDSYRIVTAGSDGTLSTYTCDICVRLPQLVSLAETRVRRTHRTLTDDERRRYLGD
jgi:WD40 repeat protein